MTTKQRNLVDLCDRLHRLGFSLEEAETLRRIEMTLHRWAELECGDGDNYASWAIERDEQTEKPYMVRYPHDGKSYRTPIADRERGALKRLDRIMAKHPDLTYYHQGDPRGCQLYILRKADVTNTDINATYTRGLAVAA
jgi:hypothetical protein